MDKVRFGRALGYGARHAAKTISAAVEAAGTPDPQGKPSGTAPTSQPTKATQPRPVGSAAGRRDRPEPAAGTARAERARLMGRSIWGPLALFSGVLWLRFTGLFFGLIALSMGSAAWRLRGVAKAGAGSPLAHRFLLFSFFAVLFGYFAASSFVRASMKERRARTPGHGRS